MRGGAGNRSAILPDRSRRGSQRGAEARGPGPFHPLLLTQVRRDFSRYRNRYRNRYRQTHLEWIPLKAVGQA